MNIFACASLLEDCTHIHSALKTSVVSCNEEQTVIWLSCLNTLERWSLALPCPNRALLPLFDYSIVILYCLGKATA